MGHYLENSYLGELPVVWKKNVHAMIFIYYHYYYYCFLLLSLKKPSTNAWNK